MASNILRKVGWVLIVVGLIDIGVMVYCIKNRVAYSSSLNVFAVIGGVFLLRQNLQAARIIANYAAFMFAAFVCMTVLMPLIMPVGLLATMARLNPLSGLSIGMFLLFALVFVFWVYRNLTLPSVMQARQAASIDANKPKSFFILGAALAIVMCILVTFGNKSDSAEKAIAKAKETMGSNYSYYVSSMRTSGDSGKATVTAYTASEIKYVEVEW
jgi:hypothetical protein